MRKDITTLLGQAMALTIDIDKKGIHQMSMTCYGILGIDISVHVGFRCPTIARIDFNNNKDTKSQLKKAIKKLEALKCE